MGKFKVFDTINNYIKLYEADEEAAGGAEQGAPTEDQGEDQAVDATGQEGNPAPPQGEQQPKNPENIEVSPTEIVKWAEAMLQALAAEPIDIAALPPNIQKVTAENANEVLNTISALGSLNRNTSEEQTIGNGLKNMI